WMDADDVPYGPGGGEKASYLGRSYRVKNAPLDRLEELLLVQGFDREVLSALRKVACVRPGSGMTAININTAVKEVLLALVDGVPETDVEIIMSERERTPYADTGQLTGDPRFSSWAGRIPPGRLAVKSDAFRVRAVARFGRVLHGEEALLLVRDGKLVMLYRQRLPWTE
ncbi:MAG: type II secretion system protein GspK, partial [Mariprofundaceae bacterium]|nr:type II secretion system protein GspK [Mariprofundaceae bacterium]